MNLPDNLEAAHTEIKLLTAAYAAVDEIAMSRIRMVSQLTEENKQLTKNLEASKNERDIWKEGATYWQNKYYTVEKENEKLKRLVQHQVGLHIGAPTADGGVVEQQNIPDPAFNIYRTSPNTSGVRIDANVNISLLTKEDVTRIVREEISKAKTVVNIALNNEAEHTCLFSIKPGEDT